MGILTTLWKVTRGIRLELGAMVFFAGLIMVVLMVNHYFLGGSGSGSVLPDFFKDIDRYLGEWIIWVAVLGLLLFAVGGYYFFDTIRKRREFNRLLDTDSKAKLVSNQERLERLAYVYLGSDYEKRFEAKKRELNIK